MSSAPKPYAFCFLKPSDEPGNPKCAPHFTYCAPNSIVMGFTTKGKIVLTKNGAHLEFPSLRWLREEPRSGRAKLNFICLGKKINWRIFLLLKFKI